MSPIELSDGGGGGGGGGAPSGAAGGVLSGTYPDPGFAADMATQAELNAVAAGLDLAWTSNPMHHHAALGMPDGVDRAVYTRVTQGGTVSKLGILVGTSSGNISVGVYGNAGAGTAAAPSARLATSGTVACPAAGFREISLGASLTVTAGQWFGISADNTTATFGRTLAFNTGLGDMPWLNVKQATGHPLPATPSSLAAADRCFVIVGIP